MVAKHVNVPQISEACTTSNSQEHGTASLLAHILISKFIDGTPLYRQQWNRLGIDLNRTLLSSWVLKCGALFHVLWKLIQQDLQKI